MGTLANALVRQPTSLLPPPSVAPIDGSAMPVLPSPALPNVIPGPPSQLMLDTAKRNQMANSGSGISQIKNPILRGIANAADIAGSVFTPRLESLIPGTQGHLLLSMHHQNDLIDKEQAQQAADTAQQDAQAQAAERTSHAAKEDQQAQNSAPQALSAQVAQSIGRPELAGQMFTPQEQRTLLMNGTKNDKPESVQQMYAEAVHDAQTRGVDPASDPKVMQLADAQTSLQKTAPGDKPLTKDEATRLNSVWDGIAGKYHLPMGQFSEGMTRADATQLSSGLNSAIGKQQGDVHISIAQQGASERAQALATKGADVDTSSPDAIASLTAVAHGAAPFTTLLPRGASLQQRQKVLASLLQINPNFNSGLATAISGTENDAAHGAMAKNMTAIRTANDHLTQLGAAATALQNGNVQALNKIGNAYNVQMGGSAATNFSTVKNAVAGELAKALTGTATVDEIHQMNGDINSAQSPKQIAGVVKTYQALMQSKASEQKKQYESGKSGNINFSLGSGGSGNTEQGVMYARDPQGKLHQAPVGSKLPDGWKAGR